MYVCVCTINPCAASHARIQRLTASLVGSAAKNNVATLSSHNCSTAHGFPYVSVDVTNVLGRKQPGPAFTTGTKASSPPSEVQSMTHAQADVIVATKM